MYQEKVKEYYDYTLNLYRVFWHGNTRAIHYGIWDKSTKNFREALLNTNRLLADLANIKPGEKVLDAGCGVGGSSFWLVNNKKAEVIGITISKKQLVKAKKLQKRYNCLDQTKFYLMDFTKTSFLDESFDIVWAIESVCHSIDKKDFIKEAYRVLKPAGRLAIADGFLEKDTKDAKSKAKLNNFLKGLALDNLIQADTFKRLIEDAGFRNIREIDNTEKILPTSKRILKMSRWSFPLSTITTWLKLTPRLLVDNNRAGIDQYHLFANRILTHKIFIAEK